jgi:hypothetical protein
MSFHSMSYAGLVTTADLASEQQIILDREQVHEWLSRDEVRNQLIELGVDIDAAQDRIDRMTGEELRLMAENMSNMPAAGGALEVVVLVLLIFILLDVAGVTDIFPRI